MIYQYWSNRELNEATTAAWLNISRFTRSELRNRQSKHRDLWTTDTALFLLA